MFTQKAIFSLYAETSVHIGGGESTGVIDKAIQRERYTAFPVGPASGIKGAIRDWFENQLYGSNGETFKDENERRDKIRLIFGPDDDQTKTFDHAGAAAFTDARILLFPVRSMNGVFAWITCPTVLKRLLRDCELAGVEANILENDALNNLLTSTAYGLSDNQCVVNNGELALEEYTFKFNSALSGIAQVVQFLGKFIPDATEYNFWKNRLSTHLLILHDDDFRDFVKHSTEVQARVKLGEGKSSDISKKGNLFYEEYLPCDTVMYSVLFSQKAFGKIKENDPWGKDEDIMELLKKMNAHRIQFGADESIGRGIMHIHFLDGTSSPGREYQNQGD